MALPTKEITIASGASLSSAITGGGYLVGVIFPATMTCVSLGYKVSVDGTNYYNLYSDDGLRTKIVKTNSAFVSGLDIEVVCADNFKIETLDSSDAAVNEAAARTLVLVFR